MGGGTALTERGGRWVRLNSAGICSEGSRRSHGVGELGGCWMFTRIPDPSDLAINRFHFW